MIDTIRHAGQLRALIVSHHCRAPGIHFFTPAWLIKSILESSHQRAYRTDPEVREWVHRERHF